MRRNNFYFSSQGSNKSDLLSENPFQARVDAYDAALAAAEAESDVNTEDEMDNADDLGGLSADERDRLADGSDDETASHSSFFAPEGPIPGPARLRRSTNAQPDFDDFGDDFDEHEPVSVQPEPAKKRGRKKKEAYVALELMPELTITPEMIAQFEATGQLEGIPLPPDWSWRSELSAGPAHNPDFQWELPPDIQGNPAGARFPRRVFTTILTPSVTEVIRGLRWGWDKCKFSSGCFEKCPTTGRCHLHFYWHHTDTKSLQVMQNAFPRANFQTCGGTEMQCRAYTSKGGFGFKMHENQFACGAGTRRDLHACGELLLSRGLAGLDEIANDDPSQFIRYSRGMADLLAHTVKPRQLQKPPTVTWFYGESGSGKSYQARQASSALTSTLGPVYEFNHLNHPWVEGYKGEQVITMQDVRAVNGMGIRIEPAMFLKLWDVDPMIVQKKGGFVQFQGSVFFVTCCVHPADFYRSCSGIDNPLQFLRRITSVVYCECIGDDLETAVFSTRKVKRGPLKNPWPIDKIEFV